MISHRTESRDTAPSRAQRLAQKGDVFFQTVRPYQRNNYLFAKPDNNYVFSTGYAQMRPKIDAEFLMCFLQTDSFVKVVLDNCTGTSYPAINSNDLSNLEISLPVSADEQREIGRFVTNLDNLITLHQRNRIILVGCILLVFILNTISWEQRKLGETLYLLKDGTHGTHSDADDGPLLLSAKNIKDGTIKWDETDRRISQEEYEKIHSKFNLEVGDVLLTIVGSIGETAILRDSQGLTFQRSVAFLRPNDDIVSEFLYSEIQTERFQKELESRKSTSAQPGIYLRDLAEIPFYFSPKLDEQKRIGEYFGHLDNLITLHQ